MSHSTARRAYRTLHSVRARPHGGQFLPQPPPAFAGAGYCPKCQGAARAAWLVERQAELLPVQYFHVVFALPAPAAEIAFQNKEAAYAILFKAGAETLSMIAADPKHLGAEIGFVAVLHTWGQNLQHHPHVHCLVPGGGNE